MTDNTPIRLSRRRVLAGLGAIGIASAGAGLGTTAYFSDQESFTGNTLTAGQFALLVDWEEHYDMGEGFKTIDVFPDTNSDGEQDFGDMPFCDFADEEALISEYRSVVDYRSGEVTAGDEFEEPEPLVWLDDVKPGDCWESTLSYHLCDNPGCVWFRVLNTELENGPDDSTHLADEAYGRVWYDMGDGTYTVPTYDPETGELLPEDEWDEVTVEAGDNSYLDGVEPLITQGSLRDVLTELEAGLLLDADPLFAPGEANGNGTGDSCVELPKFDDTPSSLGVETFVGEGDDEIELNITAFHYKDDDTVVGFDWESNFGICLITVKGGPTYENNVYNCAKSGTAFAPMGAGRGGTQRYEISHYIPWYCPDFDEEVPPEIVCHPAEETHYIGFEWCLPHATGNEVQQDSLMFDIEFYTEQSRHNPDPANPFEEQSGNSTDTANGDT